MVTGSKMPIVNYKDSFKKAIKVMSKKKLGIVVLLKNKFIAGLVTDGDLRRELNKMNGREKLDKFMTINPMIVNENMPASKALAIMSEKKITSLLVTSDKNEMKPKKNLKGIIHIHSLLKNGIK